MTLPFQLQRCGWSLRHARLISNPIVGAIGAGRGTSGDALQGFAPQARTGADTAPSGARGPRPLRVLRAPGPDVVNPMLRRNTCDHVYPGHVIVLRPDRAVAR